MIALSGTGVDCCPIEVGAVVVLVAGDVDVGMVDVADSVEVAVGVGVVVKVDVGIGVVVGVLVETGVPATDVVVSAS
jgi:hypothetical protein